MRVRPHVKLNSVHPCTDLIWPQYLHLKLILSILNMRPLRSCRKQGNFSQEDACRHRCGVSWPRYATICTWCLSSELQSMAMMHKAVMQLRQVSYSNLILVSGTCESGSLLIVAPFHPCSLSRRFISLSAASGVSADSAAESGTGVSALVRSVAATGS